MGSRILVVLIAAAAVLSAALYVVVRLNWERFRGGPVPAGEARAPAALYARYCAGCHGAAGKGDGAEARLLLTRPRDLTAPGYLSGLKDDYLFDLLKEGGSIFGKPAMPRFSHLFSDGEIRALVAHVRRLEARR
jgi:mono/diheme cytochrome c family protein